VTPHDDSNESAQLRCKVPQNAITIELCLRITNGNTALALWKRLGVKCSLHCSPPEQLEISSIPAARNGVLPKRYASCPLNGCGEPVACTRAGPVTALLEKIIREKAAIILSANSIPGGAHRV